MKKVGILFKLNLQLLIKEPFMAMIANIYMVASVEEQWTYSCANKYVFYEKDWFKTYFSPWRLIHYSSTWKW